MMKTPIDAHLLRGLPALAVLALAVPAPLGAQEITLGDIAPRDVRVEAFRLDRAGAVRIEAVGAESGGLNKLLRARNAVARFVTSVLDKDPPRFDDGWSATAWLLDAETRRVVWRLDGSETRFFDRGLHAFEGEIDLPAGTYELYLANFPDVGNGRAPGWEYDREAARRLHVTVEAEGLEPVDAQTVHEALDAGSVFALGRDPEELNERIAFDVDRRVDVVVYMVGEASRNRSYDTGWIIDATTREPVWSFDWVRSQPAGGTARNRVVRERITLEPGRYAAFFSKDRSHGPGSWRGLPPGDPAGWGLSLRPVDGDGRAAFRTYPYEPVPRDNAIVDLTRIADNAAVTQGFTLTQPLAVRVFALGEASGRRLADYAWIEDAATHTSVWQMEFETTRHAGGAPKNRVFDGVVQLGTGSYIVHYRTDGSHAYGDWNARQPVDAEYWGVTVLPAVGPVDPGVVQAYDENADPAVIARIVQVPDGSQVRRRFTLDEETDVRIYALGESSGSEMFDYARIVDAQGREIWRMRYEDTDHAGGASKNRVVNRVLRMAPGDYEVIYRTDDSHAWGDWNATPPRDTGAWGVTLRRER